MKINKNLTIVNREKININRVFTFIIAYYFIEAINKSIKIVFPIPEALWGTISNIFMTILVVFMLLTIKHVLRRNLISFIVAEGLLLIIYLISLMQGNSELKVIIDNGIQTLGVCIPLGIYFYTIDDYHIFMNTFLKYSYLLIIILSASLLLMARGSNSAYNMSLSYSLLLPTLFQLKAYTKKHDIKNLLFFFLGFIVIVLFGARGPLISIIYMITLDYLIGKINVIKKIGLFTFLVVSTYMVYVNFESIGFRIIDLLASKGIYSRTVSTFFQGSFTNSSARISLYNHYWEMVIEKPIFGWGVYGGWISSGLGPHNMILELLLAFGIILGGIISILLVFFIIRIFFIQDSPIRDLLIIYSSYNIVMFLTSGNFLEKPNLFIFIMLSIYSIKNKSRITRKEGMNYV